MHLIARLAITICSATLVACGGGGAETTSNEQPQTPVTLSVAGAGPAVESSSGSVATFRITASRTSATSIEIDFETQDGSAVAGADYTRAAGRISLPAGLSSIEIDVAVLDDNLDEPDEDFSLRLVSVSSGNIGANNASATIVDDDTPALLSIGDVSITEGDSGQTNVDFPVELDVVSGFDVSVDYATVDGTATAGSDYQAQSGTLTIPAGTRTATLSVPVIGDTVDETNESFQIQLSGVLHAELSSAAATATIIDNDNPTIPPSLSASVSNATAVSEGSAGATLQFALTLSDTAGVDVEIQYASGNQTAVAGQDFVAVSGAVTIPAGSISASVGLAVIDDALFESDEVAVLRITAVSAGSIANAVATGAILNDDAAPTLTLSDASLTEGDTAQQALVFTLSQSAVSGLDTAVSYTTVDGTAAAGDDYQPVNGTATIPAGASQTTIQVNVSGDTLSEPDETLQLILSGAQNASIVDGTGVGTIANDDALPSLSIADASVTEGNAGPTNLSFTVSLAAVSGSDVTVDYTTGDGTAIAGEDYTATSGTATITAGTTTATVTVSVTGDTLFEVDESFTLNLSNATNGSIADGTATATITNDDVAPGLSITDEAIAEGNAGQANISFVVSLDAVSGVDATVNYTTLDGTATAGEDYVSASGQLTIPAGDLQASIAVAVIGDTIDEPVETFTVSLSAASNSSIAGGSGTGTIVDDEALPAVSVADTSIAEGNSGSAQLTFTLTLSSVSASDVTVDYTTSDGTAIAGEDYTTTSGTATIPASMTTTTVTVPISGDPLFEVDETLTLNLSNATNGSIADGTATASITNDDAAPGLSISNEAIAEGNAGQANLNFVVSLDVVSGVDATVNYTTLDGTATAGDDYVAASGQLTIPAGDLQGTIVVAVIGDTIDEPDKTFTVSLSAASNSSIVDGSGVGTINDNDSVPSVSVADTSIAEGDSGSASLVFTLTLSAESGSDVTVDYTTSDGTAIAGEDYTATSGTATITAGTTTTTVTVPVTGDTLFESDETLTLALSNPVLASLGVATAVGTLVNDDVLPQLSIANTTVAEGDAGQVSLVFTISLSAAAGANVSVNFSTADGSAAAPGDFAATSGTAVLTAGVTSSTVTVDVVGDVLFEADETLIVTLSSAVNASLANDVATGTILNDDVAPVISVADSSVIEPDAGQTDAVFVVSLDTVSGLDASVSYTTGAGTATPAQDFVATSGTATVQAGELQTTIAVSVLGDLIDEADEAYSITLADPVNASLGDPVAAGTIADNDPEPVLSIADATAAEGDSGQSTIDFVIGIDAISGKDVSVDYATADDSAVSGSDYVATSGTATILAGAISTSISVTINGDSDEEGDEAFLVGLSNPVNANVFDMSASGSIIGDDANVQSGLASRPSNTSCVAPARPTSNAAIDNSLAFPNLPSLAKPVSLIQAPGDTATWYVVEQDGRILSFANNPATSTTSTFLDIRSGSPIDVESGPSEAGLFGIAFDPQYGTANWDAYLSYTVSGSPLTSVVARIQSTDNGATLDPATAEVLLTLDQPFDNHNGGHILFGPDGYLYVAFGDGGSGDDPGDRAQNTNNLFGTLVRIDVSAGTPYGIPPDNPFAGNALCNSGSGSSACPEIFAWGLRNPWRYAFDQGTNQLWLADVGQARWEEVNLVELGGNYGWRCKEGSSSNITSGNCPPGLIDPIIEYSSQTEGDSITGGEVYRGSAIPELAGRYVFADYVRGKFFASVDNGDGTYSYETLQDTSQFISSFATEANGELLYLDYGSGRIRRIIQAGGTSNNTIPDLLSESGCTAVADVTQAADGLIPYDINVPFWSDGAVKDRYYAIPDGTTIDVAADGDWLFPNGTVLVKNFRLNGNLIETRLFMRHTDGEWGGYTYEWNAGETEATRVIGGKTKSIDGQDWIYPSGSECIQCHTAAANYSLGLEHGQLNKDLTYPSSGLTGNQLTTADAVDLLTDPLADSVQNLPSYPDPTNVTESLEDRARAYLHTNCAGCHRPAGPTPSNMDLRYSTPLNSTGTCNVTPNSVALGIPNARLIMPGDATSSLVVERSSRRDIHGMPPLGSTIVDADGVQLLTDWINSLSSCP